MKRLSLALFFASAISLAHATDINGNVSIKGDAKISIAESGVTTSATVIPSGTKDYTLSVDAEQPDIVTFFVIYTDHKGEPRQMYTPIFVGPDVKEITLDLVETGDDVSIITDSPDTRAFVLYGRFLRERFKHPIEAYHEEDYLNSFINNANNLALGTDHQLASDYLKLWGVSSRNVAALNLDRMNYRRVPRSQKPEYLKPSYPDNLASNNATKYFPELVAAVSRQYAKGESLAEKFANLANGVSDPELVNIIQLNLINNFVRNKGNKDHSTEQNIAELKSVAAGRPEFDDWVNKLSERFYANVGETAPDDILFDANGNEYRLSDFQGKYVFIDFWASWCVHCRKQFPAMEKIKEEFKDSDIMFIGISLDEDVESWKKAMKQFELECNEFIVSSPALADKFQLTAIPRFFIYDRDSKLLNNNAPWPTNTDELVSLLKSLE